MPIEPARFWMKVSAVEEGPLRCWPWLGALARLDGRARCTTPIWVGPTQAARIAWQLSHHSLPTDCRSCTRATATEVRARHRQLARAAGLQLTLF